MLLFSGNNLFFPSVFLGVLMAGGVFTGANPSYVARELAHQLRDSGATFIIVATASIKTALEAARDVGLSRDRIFLFDAPDVPWTEEPSPGLAGRAHGARHWTELLQGNLKQAETWDWEEPADPETTIWYVVRCPVSAVAER